MLHRWSLTLGCACGAVWLALDAFGRLLVGWQSRVLEARRAPSFLQRVPPFMPPRRTVLWVAGVGVVCCL